MAICRTSIFSAFVLSLSLAASAHATCKDVPPKITSVAKGNDFTSVVINYTFVGEADGCAWPPDFYQIRATQGEGPATQIQTAPLKGGNTAGSFDLIFDQKKLWGFVMQACKSNFASSSDCTPWSPMRYYKPYGPNMCRSPYVWRNAFPNDFVCVTPQTSQEAAKDDAAAASRLAADKINCIYGFVWRGAIASDHVCVTPSTRQEVADDDAQAAARRLP